jgi:hypothetical protein
MVMAEKDSVGWKRYNPLTGEERRMYNAMVTPPINPHPFFSDEFEQAGVTHLSSVGGTPIFYYPESTTHLAEGEDGGAPTPILSGGRVSGGGPPRCILQSQWRTLLFLSSLTRGGGSDDAEESTMAASDGPSHPTAGGMLPSPLLPLRW